LRARRLTKDIQPRNPIRRFHEGIEADNLRTVFGQGAGDLTFAAADIDDPHSCDRTERNKNSVGARHHAEVGNKWLFPS
jgi:hypothetical protein